VIRLGDWIEVTIQTLSEDPSTSPSWIGNGLAIAEHTLVPMLERWQATDSVDGMRTVVEQYWLAVCSLAAFLEEGDDRHLELAREQAANARQASYRLADDLIAETRPPKVFPRWMVRPLRARVTA
jgi:hypothetical protein